MERIAVVVTGSRDFRLMEEVRFRMLKYPKDTIFIHGDADGADTFCHVTCVEFKLNEIRAPYFKQYGKAGGPHRNKFMIDMLQGLRYVGYEVRVEAFPLPGSRGTINCMTLAKNARIRTWVYGVDDRNEGWR